MLASPASTCSRRRNSLSRRSRLTGSSRSSWRSSQRTWCFPCPSRPPQSDPDFRLSASLSPWLLRCGRKDAWARAPRPLASETEDLWNRTVSPYFFFLKNLFPSFLNFITRQQQKKLAIYVSSGSELKFVYFGSSNEFDCLKYVWDKQRKNNKKMKWFFLIPYALKTHCFYINGLI